MSVENKLAENFPLSLQEIVWDYTQLPPDATETFYHYTTRTGLEGILRSGGLRATYRLLMSDLGEFDYAIKLFYGVLEEVDKDPSLPRVTHSLTEYIRLNLEKFRDDSSNNWTSYCACMTLSSDHTGQWKSYGENGKGLSLGFNIPVILSQHYRLASEGKGHLVMLPVTYDLVKQRALVRKLIRAGIADLQSFMETGSNCLADLTALRNRITFEIFLRLHCFKDFMKDPEYTSEKEIRFIWNPNEKRYPHKEVKHFQRGDEKVPFLLFDLRSSITNRLPLQEIRVGPNALFSKELDFVQSLLDELGYGRGIHQDRPRIVASSLSGC